MVLLDYLSYKKNYNNRDKKNHIKARNYCFRLRIIKRDLNPTVSIFF